MICQKKQWQQWLELFYQWQNRLPIVGITAFIDAPSLCQTDNTALTKHEQFFQTFLSVFQAPYPKPPLYFLVSKCDLIQGFDEFFADLGKDERLDRFGIDLTHDNKSKDIGKYIAKQSNAFIKCLSDRLIWRLHQEPDLERRELLHNFPTQMTIINDAVQKTLLKLPLKYEKHVQGIYFTSSKQQGVPVNYLMQAAGAELNFAPMSSHKDYSRQKPYFINNIMSLLATLSDYHLPTHKKRSAWQLAAYPIAAMALSIAMFILNHSYQANNSLLTHVNRQLLEFAAQHKSQSPAITKLNALNIALNSLQNQQAVAQHWLVLNQAKDLTKDTIMPIIKH